MTAFLKSSLFLVSAIFISVSHPNISEAAPIKDVLAACDKMADKKKGSCGYTINKDNGDISGCATGSDCFYCANDGKRECIKVRKQASGKMIPSGKLPKAFTQQ